MKAKLTLGTKFTLLLSTLFIAGMVVSGVVLWQVLQQRAQAEITSQALTLLRTMDSVRDYTSNHIDTSLDDSRDTGDFASHAVPAFAAREVFEDFRQEEAYQGFIYKEATLNPTNVKNKADDFETALIERFRAETGLKELSGFRTLANQNVYYVARPMSVTSQSCLTCHSDPSVAPKSMLAIYGTKHGFGWKLGTIVTSQTIYVPASDVLHNTLRSFLLIIGIFSGIFALTIVVINWLLRSNVVQPVSILGRLAQKVATDQMDVTELEAPDITSVTTRMDELGQLAQVFRRMAYEVADRTKFLKKEVQTLNIEINHFKQQKDVAEIVESGFFRELQAKARHMHHRYQPEGQPEAEANLPNGELN